MRLARCALVAPFDPAIDAGAELGEDAAERSADEGLGELAAGEAVMHLRDISGAIGLALLDVGKSVV